MSSKLVTKPGGVTVSRVDGSTASQSLSVRAYGKGSKGPNQSWALSRVDSDVSMTNTLETPFSWSRCYVICCPQIIWFRCEVVNSNDSRRHGTGWQSL